MTNIGSENHPSKFDWDQFITRTNYCTALLNVVNALSSTDDAADIVRYEIMILMEEHAIESCSYTQEWIYDQWKWYREWSLNDVAKAERRNKIADHKAKINELKIKISEKEATEKVEKDRIAREESERRRNEFWAAHVSEKKALEEEENTIQDQIAQLESTISNMPEKHKIEKLEDIVSKLKTERDALGIFKLKEKKSLQEQINDTETQIDRLTEKLHSATAPIDQKLTALKSRLRAIDIELTKER